MLGKSAAVAPRWDWQGRCSETGDHRRANMRFKVHDGTAPAGASSLCTTCRHSIVTRGQTLEQEIVQCRATPMRAVRVTFKVTSCTAYMDEKDRTYLEMLEDAWILQPATRKRRAGFVRASELRQEELENVTIELRNREDR